MSQPIIDIKKVVEDDIEWQLLYKKNPVGVELVSGITREFPACHNRISLPNA